MSDEDKVRAVREHSVVAERIIAHREAEAACAAHDHVMGRAHLLATSRGRSVSAPREA